MPVLIHQHHLTQPSFGLMMLVQTGIMTDSRSSWTDPRSSHKRLSPHGISVSVDSEDSIVEGEQVNCLWNLCHCCVYWGSLLTLLMTHSQLEASEGSQFAADVTLQRPLPPSLLWHWLSFVAGPWVGGHSPKIFSWGFAIYILCSSCFTRVCYGCAGRAGKLSLEPVSEPVVPEILVASSTLLFLSGRCRHVEFRSLNESSAIAACK